MPNIYVKPTSDNVLKYILSLDWFDMKKKNEKKWVTVKFKG